MNDPVFTVSDFVAVLNQTLEYAYPSVTIVGELANFKVSKNRWVYFDLKDDSASVRFFGTVYQLPGPLEDGMMIEVHGTPRLHAQFGFSVTVSSMRPVGEGSIKKASDMLFAKLDAEGLFVPERKRPLPYPPTRIGLIASGESAGYRDFMKIVDARWRGLTIQLADVQVQGEAAVGQVVRAIELFNAMAEPPEVLVITRGGGSADDLAVFSTEQVTRAVAASRVPTLVGIGHEVDVSLAELAADQRASTPSNAAELLVPDRQDELRNLMRYKEQIDQLVNGIIDDEQKRLPELTERLLFGLDASQKTARRQLAEAQRLLSILSPEAALRRGYAIVSSGSQVLKSAQQATTGKIVTIRFADGTANAKVQ